ncbi:5,10-methylenetetrahydrofolate reductase [Bifidobacterium actinocoloniiforme DSM 22766]|uniref:Methylenetetrahydrofolate reductase n=1 Tax=Bifidobacterium actinocoloniiforme DSM 22766 TaxID=1437605 RepID=A0A086Z0K9_9BIFI|nr:methylenetetrahydrofolate reductase [NAD(P)H] [Bifidobacterium actinocoloniiforme]AKV56074.1 5,10-methylenetetrahydrofolate reductase [Bifidobacterium actinocoloniiforme DSM 22766]KFI40059.1 5,10-methylenetetrahydrofolate reductase [Bifidobacterium actinocoloniiforme DSM 22766]
MHQPIFSLEVFPPKRDAAVGTIYDTLDGLEELEPDFISVTYGTGRQSDRTATARICRTIRQGYGISAVAHLTAQYSDEGVVREALDMFEQAGVSAVLLLRGDCVQGRKPAGVFTHACDLIAYVRRTKPNLRISAACYPETHPEAVSPAEDIRHLKEKVDAGADHLISQLFYDNEDFMRFLDRAREAGVCVPIEAGIMPITKAAQVRRMSSTCGFRIPPAAERLLDKWGGDTEALQEAGIAYASQQISDLVAQGADGIHLYSMNQPVVTRRIWRNVRALFAKVPCDQLELGKS